MAAKGQGDDKVKRERSCNWTEEEQRTLTELWLEHGATLQAQYSPSITKEVKKTIKDLIVKQVNQVGGNNRNWEQCKAKHKNIMKNAKDKVIFNKKSAKKTGGGEGNEEPLSDIEALASAQLKPAELEGIADGIDLYDDQGKHRVILKV